MSQRPFPRRIVDAATHWRAEAGPSWTIAAFGMLGALVAALVSLPGCQATLGTATAVATVPPIDVVHLQATITTQGADIAALKVTVDGLSKELQRIYGLSTPPSIPPAAANPSLSVGTARMIGNTGGTGVQVRRGPSSAEAASGTWNDGVRVRIVSAPMAAADGPWYQVEDEQGQRGWVRGIYLQPPP